ncbi:vitamin H transporter [Fusarium subglutinans]|uniref:Vitamin H transporter n=1 Tax=Gibberella subglutinans TaxID=42677 RepID=A0A8H5NRF9_GIBSU|nr:vitamin H transporter [Fusarium subglutinans]KAF5575304.1 vitamin H transporter [Fusarium subglutinans]
MASTPYGICEKYMYRLPGTSEEPACLFQCWNARILNLSTNDTLLDSNNMSQYQYVIALMIFLVAYSLFEAPSNLALKVFSPNIWLGFLVIVFGAFCAGIAGARNFEQIAIIRFFLGAFEAGVFPGMIFYMSF